MTTPDASADLALDQSATAGSENSERVAAVGRAAKAWSGQLVDLTARNNLLFYRDLKTGTLSFGDEPPAALFDLLAGKTVTLSRLIPDAIERENALKRARVVHNRSQEHFEERGLETLFLACGMATWDNQRGAATPCAPVMLCPARLTPRGAAQEEFELSITGDAEVNQTLVQALEAEFDCRCDSEAILDRAGIDGALDTPEELEIAFGLLAEQAQRVPGFAVDQRFVLATFAYAKLPMVKDLEGSLEAMVRHDLIAALAGDPDAQAAVQGRFMPVDIAAPDHTPPSDEFLVLDADASQNYAINAVLGGQDLVIRGPPGTGKSQTITNLVSTLVARGKRVLFVAEKRAAIDAVLRRLEEVGLDDLVLDLHGGTGSKREIAQRLAGALSTNSRIGRPALEAEHRLLDARRAELNAHVAALHDLREPWGISLFDAQARTLGLDDAAVTPVRLRGAQLERLDERTFEEARERLREYVGLGGLSLADSASPWAKASIVSAEEARAAQAAVDRLATETLPAVRARLHQAAEQAGLRAPDAFSGWRERLALWASVAETLERFEPGVFELPLAERAEALAPMGGGAGMRAAAAMTNGEYRTARKEVKGHVREGAGLRGPRLLEALTAAQEQSEQWQAASQNGKQPTVPDDLDGLTAGYQHVHDELAALAMRIGVERIDGSEQEVAEHLDRLRYDTATLAKLPALHRLRGELDSAGLRELLGDVAGRRLTPALSLPALEHAWLWSLIDHIRLTDPRVGAFDGEQHSRTLTEFQEADRRHIETTAQRVRRLAAEQAVAVEEQQPQQGMLLRGQAARKRGHLSVRQLFSGAPDVLMALKPCWAMSPLVVSQLLPADRPYFDVVVFDEASQVRPAEAIPAILRGKCLAVAGDERQLPPTAFFTGASADGEDEAMIGRVVVDSGYESILEALLPFIGSRTLEWHYRSRDERLIAFSNAHLYNWSLTTFPGVHGSQTIRHEAVPFQAGQHASEDSTAAEVQRVVALILEHAEQRPDESLGVIAMGIKHADRIEEELRRALHDRDDLEDFFDETKLERFFVKNLERVQGDERDAIILTVGYGKTADGRMQYRFGPLNQEGGERRLNVAVTRAKGRMTVVSSFTSADMDPDRCNARGVDLLRLYLQYAESRGDKLDRQALETPILNPFEIDVRDALERAGIPLFCQLGCSGYKIDFAAKHPTQPGRMVLAIETDGATYHSSATARDRDRLRQEHLENLGWRFHRIWSQDWFTNRQREIDRAVAAYHQAVHDADKPAQPAAPQRGRSRATPPEDQPPAGPFPRVPPPGSPITDFSQAQLRAVVRWVESDTLLRTNDQLLAEVMDHLGFQKRGSRIVVAITAAIDAERRTSHTTGP